MRAMFVFTVSSPIFAIVSSWLSQTGDSVIPPGYGVTSAEPDIFVCTVSTDGVIVRWSSVTLVSGFTPQ